MKNTLAFAFLLLWMTLPATASADITHLNIDHREIFQLRMGFATGNSVCTDINLSNRGLRVVQPSGDLANKEFRVPAGKEFVITDATYTVRRTSGSWFGAVIRPEIIPQREGEEVTPLGFGRVIRLPGITSPSSGDAVLTGQANFTAGVRVPSLRSLCFTVATLNGGITSYSSTVVIRDVDLQGYFVDKTL